MPSPAPPAGLRQADLREALTEYRAVIRAVQTALEMAIVTGAPGAPNYVELDSIWPDAAVVEVGGQYWQYPYTLADDGTVSLGAPVRVVEQYVPVNAAPAGAGAEGGMVEARHPHPGPLPPAGEGVLKRPAPDPACLISPMGLISPVPADLKEASHPGPGQGTVWRVRAIRAGLSLNKVFYPDKTLREAAPLFEGARVFEKPDIEHLNGQGKATKNLVGQLRNAQFVEGNAPDTGEVQADLHVLESSGLPARLAEMWRRGMAGLVGFSIDATGATAPKAAFKEATRITQIHSLDLIVEPGAGGKIIRLIEAVGANPMPDTEDKPLQGETLHDNPAPGPSPAATAGEVAALRRRLDEAEMREALRESGLPGPVQDKLAKRLAGFTPESLREAVADEREALARLTEAGRVAGLGAGRVEAGESRAEKVAAMLDDFFNPDKRAMSFRECYADITGDTGCTGLLQHCDAGRLREAAGGEALREAVSTSTFANVLGSSITRAMLREYNNLESYNDWRWLVDVVPVRDFRTNERTVLGGYGNLPAVAQNAAYAALTSPGDSKETYAISKRGGTETISLEAVANDDVGAIRRIPVKLGRAAARTVYEFVFDFVRTNPTMGDSVALFHATHGNLGAAALDAASFAAARLAMKAQAELSSGKKLGIILKHLLVPAALEEAAYNLFKQTTNLEKTFVQSRQPMVHVVDYWTDANDWAATADKADVPLIELGFFNGNEEPELFVQDMPQQGSLFSNDQITYKIRHIYGGNVMDWRGFYKAVVA